MVVLDIDMPESCSVCPLMRCGMCIAKDSMKVTDDDYDVIRHPDCPIVTHNGHIPIINDLKGKKGGIK